MAEDYGMRNNPSDGKKYTGWRGVFKDKEGNPMTEFSMGVGLDGKEVEIPIIVPKTTNREVQILLDGGQPTEAMIQKAVDHARIRIKQNRSPFKNPEDDQ